MSHATRHSLVLSSLLLAALGTSSCAAFNKGELVLVRNVSFGQELMDLQRAKDSGALTEDEYAACKEKILGTVGDVGTVELVDLALPDEGGDGSDG